MVSEQHTPSPATSQEKVTELFDGLLFDIRKSIRYHSKRSAYFGKSAKMFTALSLFTGFGTAASVIGEHNTIAKILGLGVAFTSAIDLAFGLTDQERLHDELKRRFIELERSMVENEDAMDSHALKLKTSERLSIESDEPTIVRTLDLLCYSEQIRAQGFGKCAKLNWLRTLLCHIDLPWLKAELEEQPCGMTE